MELDGPATNGGDDAQVDVANLQTPVPDSSPIDTPVDNGISANEEEQNKILETTTTDQQVDDSVNVEGGASQQPLETEDAKQSEDPSGPEEVATTDGQEEGGQQEDVVMADDAASLASDPAAVEDSDAVPMEDNVDGSMQQEGEAMNENDGVIGGNGEAADATMQTVEPAATTEASAVNEKADMPTYYQDSSVEEVSVGASAGHADSADTTTPAQPSAADMETNAALSEEQEAGKDAPVENTGEDGASSSPTHDESEYDPSAPTLVTSSVPHGDDEYDPANPSPAGTPVASNTATGFANHRPAAEQEEYDPDHPSMAPSAATEQPVAMEVDQTATNSARGEQSAVTPAKRKADDEPNVSSDAPTNGDTNSKRPRHVDGNKSPHDDDHKHGRHRRGSGDSTTSSSIKHEHHEEDHKGLSAAAWDRLMDFQTSGEFRVTQVSRAAFASVGAMPEFAQIAIIARFVRTPMREVRDKNGQLMRIYREYQKENPQIAALQPVDAFISDYKSDPGLFRFGYAPPQPATGISNVQVPYQRDQPPKDTPARNSPRQARGTAVRSEPVQHQHKDVDEFGRAVHLDQARAQEPNVSARTTNQRSAVDPRLASRGRQGLPSSSTQAVQPAATGARAEDPRRRDQPHPQSSSGAGRDPRRRGSSTSQQPSPRGGQLGPSRTAGASDLYERLPAPVKAVVDSMRREGRLQEPLNDNVVTRLLHLPERVALKAVENFSNVDLSQVENLQGFLVGIINRVNEKAIASEKQHRPQVPSPRGHPPSVLPLGGTYAAPPQGGSVLGGPPQGGRLNSSNGANGGGYRGQPAPMAVGSAPALYERPYDAPQDTRDPRRRQPAPQGQPQYGGAVRGPPPTGAAHGPIGMQSFTVLPVSVQNHIHSLVANRTLSSLEELGGKCYEVLGQLSEPLANQVLTRFAGANLSNVRNKSGFLIGVVKRARQEYGFN